MLVTLGARSSGEDVVDLLAACHRRIRQHLVLARRLVAAGPHAPPHEVRETAQRVARYFGVAFPLHIADEDQTIAPRLADAGDAVTKALAQMSADHVEHQADIDRLVAVCSEIEQDPTQLTALAAELSLLVEAISLQMATHLELEENVVFPALRLLDAAERGALLSQMRERRRDTGWIPERHGA